MEWNDNFEDAPKDGTPILIYDGFGIMQAWYVVPMSYDDFLTICDEGEGVAEWKAYDAELRADPLEVYDEWAVYEFGGTDCIFGCTPIPPIKWFKPEIPSPT